MDRKSYILEIEKPCQQEWTSMTKSNTGKFCSHCSKNVIDFTNLVDNEIFQIIEQNSGKLCGRLTKEQLNRTIKLYQPANNSRLYKILVGILLLGASKNLLATDNKPLYQDIISLVDNSYLKLREINSRQIKDTLHKAVKGIVIDSKTKEPIPFASIIIKGTKKGTPTDINGKFELSLPDSLITKIFYLEVSSIGYEKIEIQINKNDLPINIEVKSMPSTQVLIGEVVIVKKKKWWQRKKKNCP